MNKNTVIIILSVVVAALALNYFYHRFTGNPGNDLTDKEIERLKSDNAKYQAQIEELRKQLEVKQIQIEQQVKEEAASYAPDSIAQGIVDELEIK